MKILSNQIKCLKCGDTPYSAHRHDFKYCKCGLVAVDGGTSYLRRVGDLSNYSEMSISIPEETFEACKEALEWCDNTGRNNLGRICALFRALRDSGYFKNN